jgi:integrase
MTQHNSRRKTHANRFPLTLHPTGQYCKKIKGKLYYFGSDKSDAFQRYLEQASFLHLGRASGHAVGQDNITVKTLCNLYLEHQCDAVQAGQMSASHYKDQVHSLRLLTRFLGQACTIGQIATLDLQNYRRKLLRSYKSGSRINLHVAIMKSMFHWAKKNDVLEHIPNIDSVGKVKIAKVERPVFTRDQALMLIEAADTKMCAMIWLALNCGFGCTDCAELRWTHVDFEHGRVDLARTKTGISRNLPLWPETIAALKEVPESGDLVFYTSKGNAWVRTIAATDEQGNVTYANDNAISKAFSKLMRNVGMEMPRGVGFYTLRRTAATLAARSGDPFAVQRLLGHADLKMATTYVQDVSEQTDRVVTNVRKLIIQDGS